MSYYYNDRIRIRGTFKTVTTGAVIDPTTITVRIEKADGTIVQKVYGTDVEVVKESTGVYSMELDIDLNTSGTWRYKFSGTGSAKANTIKAFPVVATTL